MIYFQVVEKVNVYEAKTRLSSLLDRAAEGRKIVICRRNVPIAEIHPLPRTRRNKRPIGLARGTFEIPDSFYDPLPKGSLR